MSVNTIIQVIESELHDFGIKYLEMCNNKELNDLIKYIESNSQKYNEINNWLLTYSHKEYVICPWTNQKIYDPIKQLINRIQHFNKYNSDNYLE